MPHKKINPLEIEVLPLSQRKNYLDIERLTAKIAADTPIPSPAMAAQVDALASRIKAARLADKSVMLAYGAHLIKNGGGVLLRALMDGGYVTHLATQGAGTIHDWEFAWQGKSSESVADNAPQGRFGSWDETGRWINLAVIAGAAEGLGYGESLGRLISTEKLALPTTARLEEMICENPADELTAARADLLATMRRFNLPAGEIAVPHLFKKFSALGGAYERNIPFTVHPGIGYDIIVNHPFYCGAAIGRGAETDARIFADSVLNLGVYMSVGCAIMSPQVFEKAFSLANNLRRTRGHELLRDHYIAVVDIQNGGGWNWKNGEPPKDNPAYYLRFCKSFYRMGGVTDYLCGDNIVVLKALLERLKTNVD
ncbi:MAG TPA: hypothetical protein PKK48_08155 [Phycisphaerae bacterium]|nr:hypothetical protein [Phycisphaerae bacterium]HPS53204.1 hypothetical protein [Phycisphaerae bacterium]